MHSGVKSKDHPAGDVEDKNGKYHFKPNTITYSTKHSSEEGKKIAKSKLGIAIHTSYKGGNPDHPETMKATYAPDLSHFKHHPDVHNIDTQGDAHNAGMTPSSIRRSSIIWKKPPSILIRLLKTSAMQPAVISTH